MEIGFFKVFFMFQLWRVVSRNMSGVFQRKVNLQKQKLMKSRNCFLDITGSQNDLNQTTEKDSLSNYRHICELIVLSEVLVHALKLQYSQNFLTELLLIY